MKKSIILNIHQQINGGGGWSDLASVLIMSTLGLCKKDKSRLEESLTLKVALRVILSTQLSVCL